MTRYFFHLKDHEDYADLEGSELPNDNEARRAAVAFLGAVLHDEPDMLWDGRDLQVHVVTQENRLVCTVVVVGVQTSADPQAGNNDR